MTWTLVLWLAAGAYAFEFLGLDVIGSRPLPSPLERCLVQRFQRGNVMNVVAQVGADYDRERDIAADARLIRADIKTCRPPGRFPAGRSGSGSAASRWANRSTPPSTSRSTTGAQW